MSRGYFAIGLQNCKTPVNLGSVLRLAYNYDAAFVAVSGPRIINIGTTNTLKTERHKPLFFGELETFNPFDCVPIAIEITDNAKDLRNFNHPQRAFYIFGPEDGSIRAETLKRCKDVVMIPTNRCLNLAMTVATVLYDRVSKLS